MSNHLKSLKIILNSVIGEVDWVVVKNIKMNTKSKQDIEYKISQEISKILRTQLGEYSDNIIVQIIEDNIIIRIKNILTPAERQIIGKQEGVKLVSELKNNIFEKVKPILEKIIINTTNAEVIDIYSSVDIKNNERVGVFTLNKKL
ncbi:MAG: hypothetical protein A2539_05480 [Elusimicrobia bacterium RIFOXYD2_FULL_34_15]|nr:MAG: hypothetical protein A2539_05480 [Elusimicrobia bacterium RIFOXYD2_FULL_34_15]